MIRILQIAALIAACAACAAAQDPAWTWRPDPGMRNVATPGFGTALTGASEVDLGLAGQERIGVELEDDSYGRGPKILVFRTPRPLYIRPDQVVRFRVLVGEVDEVTVEPESTLGKVKWSFTISQVGGPGGRTVLYSNEIPLGEQKHVRIGWYSELEIEVRLLGRDVRAARPLWITVAPAGVFESGTDRPLDEWTERKGPGGR
jgi:hypothetical protein